MRQLPVVPPDPNLIIGTATADDAGVYRLTRQMALVQTADFFTPIVDDPFAYGQIAAANSLSDVYAMGGRPLTALNLLGVPTDKVPPWVISRILAGGQMKAREAGCTIVGGHTLRLPEPVYGMSVTGIVSPGRIIANHQARKGDLLVLTKPLGSGIATTAIKTGAASQQLVRRVVRVMSHLNIVGSRLGESGLVRAGTDVTGFGLLGHLAAICRSSGVTAAICPSAVPVLSREVYRHLKEGCVPGGTKQNLATANTCTAWGKATEMEQYLLADAQTSGGLLLCVNPRKLEAVLTMLREARSPTAAVIGRVTTQRECLIQLVENPPV